MDGGSFTFGSFRLIPAQRLLLEDGKPVRLSSRALDILIALVESAGETIPKERLIARTWPDTVVGEGALRVHVAALRKALGDGRAGLRYVANVPGRGYSFVAPMALEQRRPATAQPDGTAVGGGLPTPLTRIIGRDDIIAALIARLTERRFLTIIGPGGIGKTTVAVAVAEALRPSVRDGIWFVELGSLADPNLVPSALSAALGIAQSTVDPVSGLKARLRDKHALIVLDSCERVVGAAANIVEELLRVAPRLRILATSRESLRAEGEWLHRLACLEFPPDSVAPTTSDALHYSAVELFNERASASAEGFSFNAANVLAVVEICRRLDGMPLALELAAAQVGVLGIKGLAARLDNRFALLTKGRRTALPRHQTLRATMDWSYDLLPEAEQLILKRLSVFWGDFTMEAAAAVVADHQVTTADVFEGIGNLAMKSLVATDISGEPTFHRLLDTTRLYALERLRESGELERLRRRHAEFYRDLLERAEGELQTRTSNEWLAIYSRRIYNIGAALDWAFSQSGDASLGAALTAVSVPLWMQLSLLDESRERVERAISVTRAESTPDARREMKLWAALGLSLAQTKSPATETSAAWMKVLGFAETLEDTEFQLRALWGLSNYHCTVGKERAALAFAQRFCSLAAKQSDPADLLIGHRMIGRSLHNLGNHAEARRHVEHMLCCNVASEHRSHIIRFQFDQEVMAYVSLARILWVQGFPEQAVRAAQISVEKASAIDHSLSICIALTDAACPIALLIGDLTAAERNVAVLLDRSARHGLDTWNAWARSFKGTILIRRGDVMTGLRLLDAARDDLRETGFSQRNRALLARLAEGFGRAEQAAQGLIVIEDALTRSDDDEEDGYMAEQLRIKGELLMLEGQPGIVASEDHFRHALDLASRQGALSWELRAATSLTRLWRDQHRVAEARESLARESLAQVYSRFTEGFATEDLQTAKALLEQLA
jgi:predicted ATPase/DNA-binding winged helix-turn-helix (wHTH) protein